MVIDKEVTSPEDIVVSSVQDNPKINVRGYLSELNTPWFF